jgi:hypothetical protein
MWGDPGVSQLSQLQETPILYPSATGGSKTQTLQRAGLLRRLRFLAKAKLNVSAYTAAPARSAYGLGGFLSRIRVNANGKIPLMDLSGLGAMIYNEVQNRDGSPLCAPAYDTTAGVVAAAALQVYDAISATGDKNFSFPFEFQFGLPVDIQARVNELGLWLLQNQAIDVGIECQFNPLYAASATPNSLWSGGTLTATATQADTSLQIEREYYDLPNKQEDYPDLRWVHQVIEYEQPFSGSFCRFPIPRAGLLLRAVVINLDTNGALVEYSDIDSLSWKYGSNETPVSRPGWALAAEYLQDYSRYAPKGASVLDFYKWGWEGLKMVKDTETLANLRLETKFIATTAGTQKVILDTLVPVGR